MSVSIVKYKNFSVLSSDGLSALTGVAGDGGKLIQDNFVYTADSLFKNSISKYNDTSVATGKNTYYLSVGKGKSTGDGSISNPWANFSQVSGTFSTGDVLVIDTTDGPLYADAGLDKTNLSIFGVGTLTLEGRKSTLGEQDYLTKLADIRCYKKLTKSFSQPDATNYPNVWSTTDTQAGCVMLEEVGWDGSLIPHIPYTTKAGANFAAVASSLNSTAGSCWTDGTTMYFHTLNGTNPNTDAVVYCRSNVFLDGNSVPYALRTSGAGNIENISAVGNLAVDKNGTLYLGEVFRQSPGDNTSTYVKNCYFANGGGNHVIRLNPTPAISGATVLWDRVRWELAQTISGDTSICQVMYFTPQTTGIDVAYKRCRCSYPQSQPGTRTGKAYDGVFQSWFSHGANTALGRVLIDDCQLDGGMINNSDNACGSFIVARSSFQYVTAPCDLDLINCHILDLLPPCSSGKKVRMRGCWYTPTGTLIGRSVGIAGTYDVQFCTIDARNATTNGTQVMLLNRTASLTFIAKNNLFLSGNTSANYGHGWLSSAVTGDTLTLDYNYYVAMSPEGPNTPVINWNGSNLTFSQVKSTLSQETNGNAAFTGSYGDTSLYTALKLGGYAGVVPDLNSSAVSKAQSVNAPDATEKQFYARSCPGAFEGKAQSSLYNWTL